MASSTSSTSSRQPPVSSTASSSFIASIGKLVSASTSLAAAAAASETGNNSVSQIKNLPASNLFAPGGPSGTNFKNYAYNNITDPSPSFPASPADSAVSLEQTIESMLDKGHGECLYQLRPQPPATFLTADELRAAENRFRSIAKNLGSGLQLVHQTAITNMASASTSTATTTSNTNAANSVDSSQNGYYESVFFLFRRSPVDHPEEIIDIRIACVGNVDAGKSTLLGVLTSGQLDNGRGQARLHLFRHKHEVESGRTSSVGIEITGFDSEGHHLVRPDSVRKMTWEEIGGRAAKIVTFFDLAGHEKYLKTTMFGMTGGAPEYVMLIIGANAGIIGMTKEHLGLALALNVPVIAVITKIDMCPPNILQATVTQVTKVLKSSGCRKIPLFIRDMSDVVMAAQNFVSERLCPVFQLSSVSGQGVAELTQFLNLLPAYRLFDSEQPAEFQITDLFSVPGVGTVVSGNLQTGKIHAGDTLLLGPDSTGQFTPCAIKSIQRKRLPVSVCFAGQSVALALKKMRRSQLRKGMVMVAREISPQAHWEFEAEVLVLYHSSTIGHRYQAMLHCENIRQQCRIVSITMKAFTGTTTSTTTDTNTTDKSSTEDSTAAAAPTSLASATINSPSASASASSLTAAAADAGSSLATSIIRTGDRALVRFQFLIRPEYVKVGSRLLFREGRTKGVGKVTAVL